MFESRAETPDNQQKKSSSDSWYILVVGVLMVMVMTILAILWIRERRSRIAFQNRASQLQANVQQLDKQASMLHNALQQRVTDQLSQALPIQRSEWRYATDFDPADHDAGRFLIDAEAAKRVAPFVGPGDLLIVGPAQPGDDVAPDPSGEPDEAVGTGAP
jgi:hypothetical protein